MSKLLSLTLLLLMPVFAFSQAGTEQFYAPEMMFDKVEILDKNTDLQFLVVSIEKNLDVMVYAYIKNIGNRPVKSYEYKVSYKDKSGKIMPLDNAGTFSQTVSNFQANLSPDKGVKSILTYRPKDSGYKYLTETPIEDLHIVISNIKVTYQ